MAENHLGYINPVVVVCPSGTGIVDGTTTKVRIYYVVTPGSGTAPGGPGETFALDDPPGSFAAKATCVEAKIHIRGDSTRAAPKRQYAVKLAKGEPNDGHPFLGMAHGGEHWVFNAPGVVDFTLLRNVLTFHLQRTLGKWAPRTRYFELFLVENATADGPGDYYQQMIRRVESNPAGYYQGVYINLEKINNDDYPNRIPIEHYDPPAPKAGGFVGQINHADPNEDPPLLGPGRPRLALTSNEHIVAPKGLAEPTNAARLDALQDWYDDGNGGGWGGNCNTIFTGAPSPGRTAVDVWKQIREMTDYPSFAVYFVLNELARDPDGYHKSTFFYRAPEPDGKVYAGPLWDKNKSYGNQIVQYQVPDCSGQTASYSQPDGWLYCMQGGSQSSVWWHVLLRDPAFGAQVTQAWAKLSALPVDDFVAGQLAYLTRTAALGRNNQRWPSEGNNTPPGAYDKQVDDLRTYLTARIAWMSAHLETLLAAEAKKYNGPSASRARAG